LGVEKFGKHVPKYYSRGKKKDSGVEKTWVVEREKF
jgi:hypothetical protein